MRALSCGANACSFSHSYECIRSCKDENFVCVCVCVHHCDTFENVRVCEGKPICTHMCLYVSLKDFCTYMCVCTPVCTSISQTLRSRSHLRSPRVSDSVFQGFRNSFPDFGFLVEALGDPLVIGEGMRTFLFSNFFKKKGQYTVCFPPPLFLKSFSVYFYFYLSVFLLLFF